jgi:hypothetical protein
VATFQRLLENADGHPDDDHHDGTKKVVPEKRNRRGEGDDEDHNPAGDQPQNAPVAVARFVRMAGMKTPSSDP